MGRSVAWMQWLGRGVAIGLMFIANPSSAQLEHLGAAKLPFSSGVGTLGDMSFGGDEFGVIYSPLDTSLRLYRFSLAGTTRLDRTIGNSASAYYEPSICWDGTGYAIASSTITQAEFMKVDEAGDSVVPPTGLPGIPFGGRTAAFRIRCTATGYSIFGLVLTPSAPGSSLYYTGVHLWTLSSAGVVQSHVDLNLQLAPISYIGTAGVGTEKEYYDVAIAGNRVLVAYSAECGSPAVFQTCYSVFDTAGNLTRAEAPATTITSKGPHLATDGVTIGLATLRQEQMPPLGGGNKLYVRFFDANGTPLAVEQRYDAAGDFPFGYAPTIFLHQGHFFPAYVYPNPFTLDYLIQYAEYDEDGILVATTTAVGDPHDYVHGATINLGIDLQFVSAGTHLLGKGQDGVVTITPMLFLLPEPGGWQALYLGVAALGLLEMRRLGRMRRNAAGGRFAGGSSAASGVRAASCGRSIERDSGRTAA